MKKLIIVLFVLCVRKSYAYEFPLNPDRFPSVGVSASSLNLNGHRDGLDLVGTVLQRNNVDSGFMDTQSFGADLRIPINNGVTLNFSYDRVSYSSELTRQGNIFKSVDSFNGNKFGMGVRVYFNK